MISSQALDAAELRVLQAGDQLSAFARHVESLLSVERVSGVHCYDAFRALEPHLRGAVQEYTEALLALQAAATERAE